MAHDSVERCSLSGVEELLVLGQLEAIEVDTNADLQKDVQREDVEQARCSRKSLVWSMTVCSIESRIICSEKRWLAVLRWCVQSVPSSGRTPLPSMSSKTLNLVFRTCSNASGEVSSTVTRRSRVSMRHSFPFCLSLSSRKKS